MSMNPQQPTPVTITQQGRGTPFLIRAVWFLLIGWWLSGIVIAVGYVLCALIVTLPLGIYLLHRVPQVQTLRDRSTEFQTQVANGQIVVREGRPRQVPFSDPGHLVPLRRALAQLRLALDRLGAEPDDRPAADLNRDDRPPPRRADTGAELASPSLAQRMS